MQKLFTDTRLLDSECQKNFLISEDVMMENAASALEREIRAKVQNGKTVLVFCGGGNNGADGYALARRIYSDYAVKIIECVKPKSKMCILQAKRAKRCKVQVLKVQDFFNNKIGDFEVALDCIFGSGFYGDFLDEQGAIIGKVLDLLNKSNCLKIACDVPTGLRADGSLASSVFCADITVTMGAQKLCLYSDFAKDYVGEVKVCNLGISRELFESQNLNQTENQENSFLLDKGDLILPHRTKTLVNKGSFGCAYIACGQMKGAALIAANACFNFGAGLVSLINPKETFNKTGDSAIPMEVLVTKEFSSKVSALALGMGLGFDEKTIKFYVDFLLQNPSLPVVLDADILHTPYVVKILEERPAGCVLTPHAKELSALLSKCLLGSYSVEECVLKRKDLVQKFCQKYKGAVLLAKGSNPAIGQYLDKGFLYFINPHGGPSLAKGGSGDVLSGMICALLAQGWDSLKATVNASLAHAVASTLIKNDFALTPQKLIEKVCGL